MSRPGRQSGTTGRAERQAALRKAFPALPPCGQLLIAPLIEDPPVPHAETSARLGIPVSSIGPTQIDHCRARRHCERP
jgi:hypothetical protein